MITVQGSMIRKSGGGIYRISKAGYAAGKETASFGIKYKGY
jgi:hypothetical protein